MAVPFHGFHQDGNQRFQALATDPIRSFPDHDERLTHGVIIDAAARTRAVASEDVVEIR